MNKRAYTEGYMDKEALSPIMRHALKESLRFGAYGLGGASVGASLGAGLSHLIQHQEAVPIYMAGGGLAGYIAGLVLKYKADKNRGRKQRKALQRKKQLKQEWSEQDQRNLDVLEDLAAGGDI
jgi:hypothetical protein